MDRRTRGFWTAAAIVVAVLTVAVLVADGPLPGEISFIGFLQDLGEPVPTAADMLRATTGTEGNLVFGAPFAVWAIRRHGRAGVAAVMICLVSMLIVQPVTKELIDRDRPNDEQVEVRADHSSRAYPSGHSLSTATTWGSVALYAWRSGRRRVGVVVAVPIVLTAFASGVHGVHWASDAIAGTILGLFAAWLAVGQLKPPEVHTPTGAALPSAP